MTFIKLKGPLWIRVDLIQSVQWSESLNMTVISGKNCSDYEVEETVDEVMALIESVMIK